MKFWLTRTSKESCMLTTLPPILAQVNAVGRTKAYVRPGDPVGLKNICVIGLRQLLPGWRLGLLESVQVDLDARILNPDHPIVETHGLDTQECIFFYEQDYYVFSNFSAFRLQWMGQTYDTSEAAYQAEKFPQAHYIQQSIRTAPSAHQAFKLAEENSHLRREDWDEIKVDIMRDILRAKLEQHEYVRRKLLASGTRQLIENSWRDDFWGWGPLGAGQNMLGKLWMELRAELTEVETKLKDPPCGGAGSDWNPR